jgi:hypothetical protein
VIEETRMTRGPGLPRPYTVMTPAHLATDKVFDKWFIEQAREFLHRKGINAACIPDEQIAFQIRNTFASVTPRSGGIDSAVPVQSE